jgi:hypothetical protein
MSRGDTSDFAAKRLHITAQGFSPGLCVARNPPWKRRPTRVPRIFACYSICASNIGCPFQGTFQQPSDPGLKPWAVLYSRFAAKPNVPTGNHPSGYSSNRASKRFRSVSRALSGVSSAFAIATHNAINPSRSPRSINSESIRPSGVQLW